MKPVSPISDAMVRHELRFSDLPWPDFVVLATKPGTHYIQFQVYEVTGRAGMADDSPLTFHGKDWTSCPADDVTAVEQAETFCDGTIKWDGCAEITLGHHHFCDLASTARVGLLLERVYGIAYEMLADVAIDEKTFREAR